MSLDADPVALTQFGTVTIYPEASPNGVQITVVGFEAKGATCRDVAVLATIWAIGQLQRSLMKDIERPGGGAVGIG